MTNSILGEASPPLPGRPAWPTLPPRTLPELERLGLPELLARVPRWGGLGPSVLRHTILTVRIAVELAGADEGRRKLAARYAAAHDLAEGVLLDLPRPLKELLPDYRALEVFWGQAIHEALGLAWTPPASLIAVLEEAHEEATALEMWMIDHPDAARVCARVGWDTLPDDRSDLALSVFEVHSDDRLIVELQSRLGLPTSIACCRACGCIDAEACDEGCDWVDEDPPHPDGPICSACVGDP